MNSVPSPGDFPKLCECGCGRAVPIAKYSDKRKGIVKGQPTRFINGHNGHIAPPVYQGPTKLCECGCGRPTSLAAGTDRKNGKIQGHPTRFILGHGGGRPTRPISERFWPKVDQSGGPSACWPWTGAHSSNGYGKIGAGGHSGTSYYAHRLAWELMHGPVPAGMFVCHTCDNHTCVNPAHLFLGTHTDNMADMFAKGRSTRGSRNPQAKLTEDQVVEIRALWAAGQVSQAELARVYGTTPLNVRSIVQHHHWRHIP